jgi:hypothetical protein
LETAYLEETKDVGNIFHGWEAFLSNEKIKSKKSVSNEDRHFSLSSTTSPAAKREENKENKKVRFKFISILKITSSFYSRNLQRKLNQRKNQRNQK